MTAPSFQTSLTELQAVLEACRVLAPAVEAAGQAIIGSIRHGGKLLTCGNGGSAADALHLAEELVGRYRLERRALPALCLNADPTAITCICNDYGYESVFSRGVEALGRCGDVLVGFTTSGNSANVIAAFRVAAKLGVTTILLAGRDGGKARNLCAHEIIVPCHNTARIQEVHTLILHQWLEAIDATAWPDLLP
ncbi:MAG: SIS domain-containing protein [Verrucomicrobia bacterium]|nr:SIS domain-containing protein [Verrucomicrobiota bacterium]